MREPRSPRVSSPPDRPRSMPDRPRSAATARRCRCAVCPVQTPPAEPPSRMSSSQPARPSVPHMSLHCVCACAPSTQPLHVVRRQAIPISSPVEMGSKRLPLCTAPRAARFVEMCAQQPQNTSSQLARTCFRICATRRRDSNGVRLPLRLSPRTHLSTPCVRVSHIPYYICL
jgi:hypothetical protein